LCVSERLDHIDDGHFEVLEEDEEADDRRIRPDISEERGGFDELLFHVWEFLWIRVGGDEEPP
jgi:hypothetical protein